MQLARLQTGLFGYKKDRVYQYIDTLSSEYSEQLDKTRGQYEQQIGELQKKIAELTQALEQSERENSEHRSRQMVVADAIMDAKRYAKQAKQETLQRENEARQELKDAFDKGQKEARAYLEAVERCRKEIADQLAQIDNALSERELEISDIIRQGARNAQTALGAGHSAEGSSVPAYADAQDNMDEQAAAPDPAQPLFVLQAK